MTKLGLPLGAIEIEVMGAEDVRLAVSGLVLSRDIGFALQRLPGQVGVVVRHEERFGDGSSICTNAEDRLDTGLQAGGLPVGHT
ncbi:hypothetical protein D3C86_1590680 [compost metagenome]